MIIKSYRELLYYNKYDILIRRSLLAGKGLDKVYVKLQQSHHLLKLSPCHQILFIVFVLHSQLPT